MEIHVFKEKTNTEVILATSASELIEQAKTLEITTEEDCNLATDLTKTIKTKFKNVEDERKSIVTPFNDGVDAINARFKKITQPLKEAEDTLKSKMTKFQIALQAKRKAEQERILQETADIALSNAAEAEAAGDIIGAKENLSVATQIANFKPKTNGSVVGGYTGAKSFLRTNWNYEIIDIKAFANAYPDLIEIKAAGVRALINAGSRNIPGLKVFEETSVSVR